MPLKNKPLKKVIKRTVAKKKVLVRKPVKKNITVKKAAVKKPKEPVIGIITHYFPHVKAAVLKLKLPLSVGDKVKVKGHTTDFSQDVDSMQLNLVPVKSAKKGQEIGLLVNSRVRRKDVVYKA